MLLWNSHRLLFSVPGVRQPEFKSGCSPVDIPSVKLSHTVPGKQPAFFVSSTFPCPHVSGRKVCIEPYKRYTSFTFKKEVGMLLFA
jgi:hypothetical protein